MMEVHPLGQHRLDHGHLEPHLVDRFRRALTDLALICSKHIRIEDSIVFLDAQGALSVSQKSAIASEMASRRDLVR